VSNYRLTEQGRKSFVNRIDDNALTDRIVEAAKHLNQLGGHYVPQAKAQFSAEELARAKTAQLPSEFADRGKQELRGLAAWVPNTETKPTPEKTDARPSADLTWAKHRAEQAEQRANRLADKCGDLTNELTNERARCRELERKIERLEAKAKR
jgi:hypothetical protein